MFFFFTNNCKDCIILEVWGVVKVGIILYYLNHHQIKYLKPLPSSLLSRISLGLSNCIIVIGRLSPRYCRGCEFIALKNTQEYVFKLAIFLSIPNTTQRHVGFCKTYTAIGIHCSLHTQYYL